MSLTSEWSNASVLMRPTRVRSGRSVKRSCATRHAEASKTANVLRMPKL